MQSLYEISGKERVKINSCTGFTLIELLIVVAIIAILAAIAVPNFLEAQTRSKVARVKADMRTVTTAIETYHIDHNAYPRMNPNVCKDPDNPQDTWLVGSLYDHFLWYEWDEWGEEAEHLGPGGGVPTSLTTPVAYLTSRAPADPFIGNMDFANVKHGPYGRGPMRHCSYFFYNFPGAYKQRRDWEPHWHYPQVVSPAPMRFNGPGAPVILATWAMLSPGPDRSFEVPNPDSVDPPWDSSWVSTNFMQQHRDWDAMMHGRHSIYDPTNGTNSGGDIWRTNHGVH
jgi:type II secretion system protein G